MRVNTEDSWGSVAVAFHWGIVLLALAQVPLGFWLSREAPQARISGDETLLLWLEQFHHSFGLLIFIIALLRLAWRLSHVDPAMPPMPPYQKIAAKVTHVSLYALMFIFPLSGWAGSTLIGSPQFPVPINFFGLEMVGLDFLRSLDPPFNTFRIYRDIHIYCWWVGGGVLSLHVLAGLYHHFIKNDDVLRRMLPTKPK